jgi:hypothetical protein
MTMIDGGSAATAEPTPAPDFQEAVLALLTDLSTTVNDLKTRVEAVEQQPSGPRFVPASVETYSAPGERSEEARNATPDGIPRSRTVPLFTDGTRVPEFIMAQLANRFGPGSRVRINKDAYPLGRTDKTWGQLMAEPDAETGGPSVRNPDAVGEVYDRKFLSRHSGIWKYRVRFPQGMLPGSNGGMVMLHENELIPA